MKAADGVVAAVEKSVETVKEAVESVDPTARNSNIKIDPKDVIMMQVSCVLQVGHFCAHCRLGRLQHCCC